MRKKTKILLLLATAFCLDVSAGRNFVIIGSDAAPVKYIRGTGSNVGLYVGIELQPGAITYQNSALAKSTAFARPAPIGYKRGGDYIPGGGGQGMGKRSSVAPRPLLRNLPIGDQKLASYSLKGVLFSGLSKKAAATTKSLFQVLPIFWMNLPESMSSTCELMLPVLCQDQYADVPETKASNNFTVGVLDTNSAKTYVGIYRIDQYLKDNVAGKIWSNGRSFLYDPSEISEIELLMIANSQFILDSTLQESKNSGFYNVKNLFIEPNMANFAIWAARGNQDENACKAGLNHIRETNSLPPASDTEAIEIFWFNHIVFSFAQMPTFQAKFRAPSGILPTSPDLRPYVIIEWSPDSANLQNQNGGVQFSSLYSFDADGSIKQRKWDFGDGSTSTDSMPSHVFSSNGSFKVRLSITDIAGNKGYDSISIQISSAGIVRNNTHFGNRGILVQQTGSEMLVSNQSSVPDSRIRFESYNSAGQRISRTILPLGDAIQRIDLSANNTHGVLIWRLENSTDNITGRYVLAGMKKQ